MTMLLSALSSANAAQSDATAQEADDRGSELVRVELESIPERHPVRRFADLYLPLYQGKFLPDEHTLVQSEEAQPLFAWAKHIEPVEMDDGVDFKVLRQGKRNALRERRSYRDQWMCDTVDPEFIRALYCEVITASIMRRPRYSRGRTPTRERAYLYVIRGTFPVFADNPTRLRLFQIEAEPYVSV